MMIQQLVLEGLERIEKAKSHGLEQFLSGLNRLEERLRNIEPGVDEYDIDSVGDVLEELEDIESDIEMILDDIALEEEIKRFEQLLNSNKNK